MAHAASEAIPSLTVPEILKILGAKELDPVGAPDSGVQSTPQLFPTHVPPLFLSSGSGQDQNHQTGCHWLG